MCKQETVLKTLKSMPSKTNGLSKAVIMLAEAQAEDYIKMECRMGNIETNMKEIVDEVSEVKKDVSEISKNQSEILKLLQKKASPLNSIKELFANKLFLIIFFIVVSVILGIPLSDIVGNYIKL